MSKKIINTTIKTEVTLNKLAKANVFSPSPAQEKAKARFWSRYESGPFPALAKMTLAEVIQLTEMSSLKNWWSAPGFKPWFYNQNEAAETLDYLYIKCLKVAENLLDDPAAQASAKVNMIKVIAELANKFPSKYKKEFADEQVGRMDEKQLEAWLDTAALKHLESKGLKIVQENIIDVPKKEEDNT